jgi:hypothetical protein
VLCSGSKCHCKTSGGTMLKLDRGRYQEVIGRTSQSDLHSVASLALIVTSTETMIATSTRLVDRAECPRASRVWRTSEIHECRTSGIGAPWFLDSGSPDSLHRCARYVQGDCDRGRDIISYRQMRVHERPSSAESARREGDDHYDRRPKSDSSEREFRAAAAPNTASNAVAGDGDIRPFGLGTCEMRSCRMVAVARTDPVAKVVCELAQ